MAKNLCAKTVKREDAYEVWAHDYVDEFIGKTPAEIERHRAIHRPYVWLWFVLKKWQADDGKPNARWFCDVVSPIVPRGEMGDVYVKDVKSQAVRVYLKPFLDPSGVR